VLGPQDLALDGFHIGWPKRDPAVLARLAPRLDHDEIARHGLDVIHHLAGYTLHDRHHGDHGGDADDHAERCQGGPQEIRAQLAQRHMDAAEEHRATLPRAPA
jgi:hypothetical protein